MHDYYYTSMASSTHQDLPLAFGSPSSSDSSLSYDEPITAEVDTQIKSTKKIVSTKTSKSHPCTYCPKFFTRPSALKTHIYSHTAEKPFQCLSPGCGRKFSVVSNLRRHFKVHQRPVVEKSNQKITAKDRIQRVRQLIKSKHNSVMVKVNQGGHVPVYNNYILPYGDHLKKRGETIASRPITTTAYHPTTDTLYTQNHYLLLPPILTDNNIHSSITPTTFSTMRENDVHLATEKISSGNYQAKSTLSPMNNKDSSAILENSLLLEHNFPYFWTNHMYTEDSTSANTILSANFQTASSDMIQQSVPDSYNGLSYFQ